jgi:hypothetical protein
MQLPDVDASSEVYLKHTDHFEGAVEGWSDAEILTSDQQKAVALASDIVTPKSAALRAAMAKSEAAERAATKLRARYLIRDIVLDMRVMAVSDALLNGPALRKRDSPVYAAVFQEGTAGDVTESKLRDEPDIAERVAQRLGDVPDFEGKTRVKADLEAALDTSFGARESLDNAEAEENKAGDAELSARLAVRQALQQAYGTLLAALPGQRKLVESFFYKRERPAKKTKQGGEEKPDGPV